MMNQKRSENLKKRNENKFNVKASRQCLQLVANGVFTEFNLLKTRKASIFETIKEIKSFSIPVLTPPPLDYKRQEYLYHNIRPFVRDKFKNITCPEPIYTGNE